jgi:hypothetical protein
MIGLPGQTDIYLDEPVELKQIQDSLISHVNLDPAAAIGVLCDHCSLDPDLTAEEKEDREKLRKLVLFFLANTAKKDILAHFRRPSSEVEQVFRDGLVKVGAYVEKVWMPSPESDATFCS